MPNFSNEEENEVPSLVYLNY